MTLTSRRAALDSDALDWARLRRDCDEEAFTAIFHRHRNAVYNFAFRQCGSWSAAEDVTQMVFLSLWRRAQQGCVDRLRGDSARPILIAMARHEGLTRHRGDQRAGKVAQRVAHDPSATRQQGSDTDTWLQAQDTMAAIHEAMSVLSPEQREVVELVAFGELGASEVAAILGVAAGTVKSRLSRARAAMRHTRAAELLGEVG